MTVTRDRLLIGPQLDTGTNSPVSPRLDVWAYGGPPTAPASDTGIGSPLAQRPDTLDTGTAFIPPLWR